METRQMSLFESTFDRFIIDRPIRLIELFAGIGAQSKALENLGADFESHRVVEWSCNSIIAYNAIHVGDSIVTTVLMGIFGEMLGSDYEKTIKGVAQRISEGKKCSTR